MKDPIKSIAEYIKVLLAILEKNIKRLLSSKLSASMIIFGPLLMIFLIGFAFQSSGFFGIKVGVYAQEYTPLSQSIIDLMEKNDFTVTKVSDMQSCIAAVKDGEYHLCVRFPVDFNTEKVEFYADYSRMNLVYSLVSKLSTEINTISAQISVSATEDILSNIRDASDGLAQSSQSLDAMKGNAQALETQLYSLRSGFDKFNTSSYEDIVDTILNNQSEFNKDLAQTRINLDKAQRDAKETRADAKELHELLESQHASLVQARANLGCAADDSSDLTPYLKSSELASRIQASTDPKCALVVTLEKNIRENRDELKDVISRLDRTILYIDDLKLTMDAGQHDLRSQAQGADRDINAINDVRNNLSSEFAAMAQASNRTAQILGEMNSGLGLMRSNFDQIAALDPNAIVKPIKTAVNSVETRKIKTLDILFPAVIIMVISFVSVLLGNILVMREKTSKAYFRNLILPIQDHMFIIGTYMTVFLIAMLQIIIILGIAILAFGLKISIAPWTLLVTFSICIIIFSSLGMLIGYLSNSEETSVLISLLTSLMLLMFSNVMVPIETMESWISSIVRFSPFNISELILRRTLIYGSTISSIEPVLLGIFVAELVALLILVGYVNRRTSSKK